MSEDRIERIGNADLRSWSALASNPSIDTSPHDVGNVLRPALGRAVRELTFLRAEVNILSRTAAEADQLRSDLCARLDLRPDDFKSRRRGPHGARSLKLACAAEVLRRRGVTREAIGLVLNYSKPGVDNLLQLVGTRIRQSAAFASYVERVAR